jgi:predicted nucleotidyltransferase
MKSNGDDFKSKVVREAATLLYFGAEKEYKQAKLKAAETFGVSFLPSNLEVALELDRIAEEKEGSARKERLVLMRQEALKVMKVLEAFCPLLIGSVWRGTIRFGSDIDLAVYAEEPEQVAQTLKESDVKISRAGWTRVNKQGKTLSSYHIHAETGKFPLEIVVRSLEEAGKKRKCEVFGDEIKGLKATELERLLREHPTRQFLP